MSRLSRVAVVLLALAPLACVDEGGNEETSSTSSNTMSAADALVARAKSFELPTEWVGPPGDPLHHHTAGFAKILCSAVFITGLDADFAAENIGYFTSDYDQRSKVTNREIDRTSYICSTCSVNLLWLMAIGWLATATCSAQVRFSRSEGKIRIQVDGRPFSTLHFGHQTTKPFLHPLRSADGAIVTRAYPMEDVEGETKDHLHHRGLWFSHGDVNDIDFWANELTQEPASRKGQIVLRDVSSIEVKENDAAGGSAAAGQGKIKILLAWKTRDGTVLLTEDRTMVFHAGSKNRIVDFDLRLTAQAEHVTWGDTKEGTFALRVATPMEESRESAQGVRRTGTILSADGRVGEQQVWGTRSPWVDYSGVIEGKRVGIAVFDHPENPRHPTRWHVRSYGLFAANIFGLHHFLSDPSLDGSLRLRRDDSLRFRYRVVIHPGDAAEAQVANLYRAYTQHTDHAGGQ